MRMDKKLVVIPTYNEKENIENIIRKDDFVYHNFTYYNKF